MDFFDWISCRPRQPIRAEAVASARALLCRRNEIVVNPEGFVFSSFLFQKKKKKTEKKKQPWPINCVLSWGKGETSFLMNKESETFELGHGATSNPAFLLLNPG